MVLVVELAQVCEGLKAAMGADEIEWVTALHPGEARIAAGSRRPAVVILPAPRGDAQQAKSLRGVLPATCRILGLVGDGEPLEAPGGLDRVAPQGDLEAVEAALSALLGEAALPLPGPGSPAPLPEREEGSLPPGVRPADEPDGERDDEDADVDPARAAAIRDLALSIQVHRSLSGGAATAPAPAPVGLSLSSADREDPSQVDISVGSVAEAMADLPEPGESLSRTEQLKAIVEERDAARMSAEEASRERQAQAAALAQIRAHSEARVPTQAIELAFVKRRRRGRIVKIVVALVLCIGAGIGGFLYYQHLVEQKRKSVKPPPPESFDEALVSRAEAARKGGLFVDPYAGLIARTPVGVRATDVDFSDEQLHRSVPELDRWFEQALRRLPMPKVREQLLGRAEPLVRFDDLKKAHGYLERARKIRDGADVRALLATVSEKEGRPEKAQGHLQRAMKLDPKRHDLRLRLGLLLLKSGKAEEGCKELDLAASRLKEARAAKREHCQGMKP